MCHRAAHSLVPLCGEHRTPITVAVPARRACARTAQGHADVDIGTGCTLAWHKHGTLEAVDPSTIAASLADFELVVLNGCKSLKLAQMLAHQGVRNVVATETSIPDDAAQLFGSGFWEALATSVSSLDSLRERCLRKLVRDCFDRAEQVVRAHTRLVGVDNNCFYAPTFAYGVDPEDGAKVHQDGNLQGLCMDSAGKSLVGRYAAGRWVLLQPLSPEQLHCVPPLPDNFLPRPELQEHRELLLRDRTFSLTAHGVNSTASYGRAGEGKTTMVASLARDPQMQSRLDQVEWVTFGQERTPLEAQLMVAKQVGLTEEEIRDSCDNAQLTREMKSIALQTLISGQLRGRRVLLVSDDVWTSEQCKAFNQLTAEKGDLFRIITTRNRKLAEEHSSGRTAQKLPPMACPLARKLFESHYGEEVPAQEAERVLRACRGSPAMLRSVAVLSRQRDGVEHALRYIEEWTASGSMLKLLEGLPDASMEYGTFYGAIEGTLHSLEPMDKLFMMLGIFREDERMTLEIIKDLWHDCTDNPRDVVDQLADLQLVEYDRTSATVTLIDLVGDYLRCRGKSSMGHWHHTLLQRCPTSISKHSYWQHASNFMHHLSNSTGSSTCPSLQNLNLGWSQIRDEGLISFSHAIARGALVNLSWLQLTNNQIGDAGMRSFSDAIAGGALANLTQLHLDANRIGDEGMRSLSDAIGGGALANLTKLILSFNEIGDEGMCWLSGAIATLTKLMLLELRYNEDLSDVGMHSFSEAVASGALPDLLELDLSGDFISHDGMNSLSGAIAQGALAKLKLLDLRDNQSDHSNDLKRVCKDHNIQLF